MTIFTGARQAFIGKTFCGPTAYRAGLILTMFDLWNCFSVYFRVAWDAYSYPIFNVKHEFRVIGNFFYMMCVNCYISSAAFLTSVIVSHINSLAPFLYAAARHGADISKGFSALPIWGCFSGAGFSGATMGTKTRITAATSSAKLVSANNTNHISWYWIHGKMLAFTGAIFSPKKVSKGLYGKLFTTFFTSYCIHSNILPQFLFISIAIPEFKGMY